MTEFRDKIKTNTVWGTTDHTPGLVPLIRADAFRDIHDADAWAQEYARQSGRAVWLVYTPAVHRTGDQPWAVWGKA